MISSYLNRRLSTSSPLWSEVLVRMGSRSGITKEYSALSHSREDFQQRLAHDLGAGLALCPEADTDHTLIDEHAETVNRCAPAFGRVTQELCLRRVRDDITDDQAGPERLQIERKASLDVREKTEGRGVDQEPDVLRNLILVFPLDKQSASLGSVHDQVREIRSTIDRTIDDRDLRDVGKCQ